MNNSISFIRIFFLCLSVLFVTSFINTILLESSTLFGLAIGVSTGLGVGLIIIGLETYLKKFNIRSFNTASLGLVFGYVMGEAILLLLQLIVETNTIHFSPEVTRTIHLAIILTSSYIGMMMTLRASEEIYVSIPFLRFQPKKELKRDILLDASVLLDTRIIDLSSSGIFDNHLVMPRFTLCDLYDISEKGDENERAKARRSLEVFKKVESTPNLNLRFIEMDFPEIKEQTSKLVHLARMIEANILTTDINRVQQSAIEGVRIINLHNLSNALKPITHAGEFLAIKVQRYGKEPRQGVGYLDDGTMVVVNGGANYIGEIIQTQVLSVKHTSSGRMIFCNACEDENDETQNEEDSYAHASRTSDDPTKSYFAL